MKINKAIIPAAGNGTRFLPITKSLLKGMVPIVDKPVLQYIVKEVVDSGITDICIIVNKNDKSVEQYFCNEIAFDVPEKCKGSMLELEEIRSKAKFTFLVQNQMKGLGHAVLCAKEFVNGEPFAVLTGDDVMYSPNVPVTKQLIEIFEKVNSNVLGVQAVNPQEVSKYGTIKFSKQENSIYEVEKIVEKPPVEVAPSNICSLGRYILLPQVMDYLETQEPAKNGEVQLPDTLGRMINEFGLFAYEFEGIRYDAGDKLGYLKATCEFALRDEKLRDGFAQYLKELTK